MSLPRAGLAQAALLSQAQFINDVLVPEVAVLLIGQDLFGDPMTSEQMTEATELWANARSCGGLFYDTEE